MSQRTKQFFMTEHNRLRVFTLIKERFKENPHNKYYQMCIAANNILCIKCMFGIHEHESAIRKHSLTKIASLCYYHEDCFERLFL